MMDIALRLNDLASIGDHLAEAASNEIYTLRERVAELEESVESLERTVDALRAKEGP